MISSYLNVFIIHHCCNLLTFDRYLILSRFIVLPGFLSCSSLLPYMVMTFWAAIPMPSNKSSLAIAQHYLMFCHVVTSQLWKEGNIKSSCIVLNIQSLFVGNHIATSRFIRILANCFVWKLAKCSIHFWGIAAAESFLLPITKTSLFKCDIGKCLCWNLVLLMHSTLESPFIIVF